MELAYFHTDISDMIVRVPTGRVIEGNNEVTKRNGGDGFTEGIEFRGTFDINRHLRLYGNYAWLDGAVDTFPTSAPVLVREPISRLMPQTAHLGLRWRPIGRRYWAEALATWVDDADKLSTRDQGDTGRIPPGGTPGYELLTLRGGYRLLYWLDVTVALENLTDEEYRAHGSGQNEPGRNFVVTFSADF